MRDKKLMCGVLMVVFGFFVALFLTAGSANAKRLQEMHHSITLDTGNPYTYISGAKDPIRWGGLPEEVTGFINRSALEKHNLVIRITEAGLREIGNLISDMLKYDPSVANLINYFAMSFLDRCTDTKVVADFWDSLFEFQEWLTQNYSNNATKYYYYQTVATNACGITPSSPYFSYGDGTTHCFGNEIYFEYIGGYNPTGTWDEGTNMCKDDGKGLFSMCLPIPLLNDEGAPICVNAVIYGQERNKQPNDASSIRYYSGGFYWPPFVKCGNSSSGVSNFCPNTGPDGEILWDDYYFLARATGG